MRKHYRMYYKQGNGFAGVGIEEYVQGDTQAEVVAFASLFIDQNLTDYELITKILEEYCDIDNDIKVKFSQRLPKETLDELSLRYPSITFRRARTREIENIRILCFDSLDRKTSIYEII